MDAKKGTAVANIIPWKLRFWPFILGSSPGKTRFVFTRFLSVWSIVTLLLFLGTARAFNVNITQSIPLTGSADSNFGFSVALWKQNERTSLVIGAPKIEQAGSVFVYNSSKPLNISDLFSMPCPETKDYQERGRGFVLAAGKGQDSPLLTFLEQVRGTQKSQIPIGHCALLSKSNQVCLKPNVTDETESHFITYCGFGASFTKDGKAVLITCPAIIDESSHAHVLRYDLTPPSGPQREDITGGCLNNLYSGWGMASMDVDHMALTCGREGMIREADFQMNFETLLEGNASKMGEMTGFSIAACDVNGDGLDEVIVGIPFGRVEQNSGWKEMGSVIVKGMGEPKTIFGYSEYSRFGSSVACVGDLNKDNFTDIAVGAPEHPEGGALFLYFGSKNGLIEEPSQVIYGRNLSESMMGFGYSIAGGKDVDENIYPEILVGAPHSSYVGVLRTIPVMRINVSSFHFEPDMVLIGNTYCTHNCTNPVLISLVVELVNNSPNPVGIDMTLKMQLDVGAISKRILFQENHKSTLDYNLRMTSTSTNKTFIVYVEDLASAKNLTVSKAQVTVNPSGHFLVNSSNASELYGVFEEPGRPGVEWKNREYETSVRLTCSSNNTCFKPTNIGVAVEQNRLSFKVGRNDIEISLNVSVENNIAFDLHLEISKTPGLEMKSAVVSSTSVVLTCREGTNCKPHNITCNICAFPEKIMPGSMMLVKLTFQQNQDLILNQTDSKPNPELTTRIRATVFNEDSNPEDDSVDVTFLPSVEIDFSVIGVSTPETISLDLSETFASQSKVKTLRDEQSSALENPSISQIGPVLEHNYTIPTRGVIPLKKVQVDLYWPVRSNINNLYISLLTDMPKLSDPELGNCNLTRDVFSNNETMFLNKTFIYDRYSCDLQLFKSKADLILSVKAVVVGSFFQENIKNFQLASYLMGRVLKPLSWGVNGTYHLERRTVTQQKTIETPLLVIVGVTSIPAFVIPLAILVGLVLLALLALCLYKLGFFKRKRVPKQSEDNQRIIHKIDETLHVD